MTLYEFIKLCPANWPQPDPYIILNDDAGYDIDWDFGKGKVVSITIDEHGNIGWAALIDGKSQHGKKDKPQEIPKEIIDIFTQLGF
jgi:hypothetical protein